MNVCGSLTYRVDECVRALHVADWRVERQTEMDRVVQPFLETHRVEQQHVSETQQRVSESMCVSKCRYRDTVTYTNLDPGGREIVCSSPLWMALLQWLE